MKIAITGGVGSGKSSIGRVLARFLDAALLSADDICRRELAPGGDGYRQFASGRGSDFLTADGEFDRAALGRAVFADRDLRRELEAILHPLVRRRFLAAGDRRTVVAEVPLLYESGWEGDFNVVVCVRSAGDQRVARVIRRDGRDRADVQRIVAAQLPEQEKLRRADFIIDNSGLFTSSWSQLAWLACRLKEKI